MSTPLQTFLSTALGPLPALALPVLASARVVEVDVGEPLLRAGARWSSLFWIEQGVLRPYDLGRQGKSANKNFHLETALLWPLTPALAAQPVDFWIEAITPARVWMLPAAAWQTACDDWPAWSALERRTLAMLLDDKMQREQQFLQCSATQRYEDLCLRRPTWLERIALRHLAS